MDIMHCVPRQGLINTIHLGCEQKRGMVLLSTTTFSLGGNLPY